MTATSSTEGVLTTARFALPSVSAVLPAFNEEAIVADVAARAHQALVRSGVDFEVVVVDDGSHDATAERILELSTSLPLVRLVSHEVNRGYGAALRTGFEAAQCDAVWLMDSDGQFDPGDLPLLLDRWSPDTLVAGYRARRQDPLARRLNHNAFFALVRVVMGPTVRDVNCAFKLFPREVGVGLRAEGAMISTELVLRAHRRGLRTVEVSVPHHPRTTGRPTGADPRVVAKAFRELWRMRRRTAAERATVRR